MTTTAVQALAQAPWITPRQLDFWCRSEYIKSATQGSGSDRVLTQGEVRVFIAMARLVRAGLPAALASRVARTAVSVGEPGQTVRIKLHKEDPGIKLLVEL